MVSRIRLVAYKLALPLYSSEIYDVLHVLLLWKIDVDPSRVLPQISWEVKEDFCKPWEINVV